jgi:hypothetical protein
VESNNKSNDNRKSKDPDKEKTFDSWDLLIQNAVLVICVIDECIITKVRLDHYGLETCIGLFSLVELSEALCR